MKSFLFGTAALTTLCLSLPALAADLPARVTKAPPVLVSPAYDWSGFYVGVHAGYNGRLKSGDFQAFDSYVVGAHGSIIF